MNYLKFIVLFLMSVSIVFAANEISFNQSSDDSLYYLIRNATGQVWDLTTDGFVSYNSANQGQYDFQLTDAGGDFHFAVFSTGESISAGVYVSQIWKDANGDTTPDGTSDTMLGPREDVWDGTNIQTIIDTSGETQADTVKWNGEVIPATTITGVPEVDNTHWRGTALAINSNAGVPAVDVTHWKTAIAEGADGIPFVRVTEWGTELTNGNVTWDSTVLLPKMAVYSLKDESPTLDNLISTYNGSGYTDDNAPAKQIQVSGIGSTGGATNEPAIASPDGFTILNGLNELNTEDDTHADNGTLHSLDNDGANILDCYYVFDIGGAFVPADVVWRGRVFGNNDDLTVSVNTGTIASPSWQERSLVNGSNSTVIIAHTVKGKGVSFMEHVVDFHGRAPSEKEKEIALRELAGIEREEDLLEK